MILAHLVKHPWKNKYRGGMQMKTTKRSFLLVLITLLLVAHQIVIAQTEDISKLNKDLIKTASVGDSMEAEALLESGADANAKNSSGRTVLMLAAMRGNIETVQLLLKAGADMNVRRFDGATALTIAINKNHKEVESLLRKAGAKE
jgi:ankyrin repeat protein